MNSNAQSLKNGNLKAKLRELESNGSQCSLPLNEANKRLRSSKVNCDWLRCHLSVPNSSLIVPCITYSVKEYVYSETVRTSLKAFTLYSTRWSRNFLIQKPFCFKKPMVSNAWKADREKIIARIAIRDIILLIRTTIDEYLSTNPNTH